MKNARYEVVTFTGKTWENINDNGFSSRVKAEEHLQAWITARPFDNFKIIDNKKRDRG